MDPISQGVLGAAAAQAAFGRRLPRSAWAIGGFAGLLADLDIFIRIADDPVLTQTMHRHFSHSLAFIPVGGLIGALVWIGWPWFRGRRRAVLGAAMIGYATHAPLDACTSYGTLLWWPFSYRRVAWDVISIIDPAFTAVLALGVLWAAVVGRARPAAVALVIALGYLGLGLAQHTRALDAQAQLAASRGHTVERGRVMPTLGNLVVWRSVYASGGELHGDTVRVGLGQPTARAGFHAAVFDPVAEPTGDPRADAALRRWAWFADGYVARYPDYPALVGDARYVLDPGRFVPMWGVVAQPGEPVAAEIRSPRFDRRGTLGRLWRQVTAGLDDAVVVGPEPSPVPRMPPTLAEPATP